MKKILQSILLILFLIPASLSAKDVLSMEAGSPFDAGGGNAKFPGQIVVQTDKYIVCDVFTSTGINACIDLLGSGGGEVYLPEGIYAVTTGITIDQANTTITGSGAGTILDASAVFDVAPVAVIDTNDINYTTIRNLRINGGAGNAQTVNLIGDSDDADNLIVSGCYLYDGDNDGIAFGGENSQITNNYCQRLVTFLY